MLAGDRVFLHDPHFEVPIDTPVDRINVMMRESGQHLWSYDAELLTVMLLRAGFSRVDTMAFGESGHARMRGIDTLARR